MTFPKELLNSGVIEVEIKEFGELTIDDGISVITLNAEEVQDLISYLQRWQDMVFEKWAK